MTTPADPDPTQIPDADSAGTPPRVGGTPDSDSTSLASDSAATGQSPAPTRGGRAIVPIAVVGGVILVVLIVAIVVISLG